MCSKRHAKWQLTSSSEVWEDWCSASSSPACALPPLPLAALTTGLPWLAPLCPLGPFCSPSCFSLCCCSKLVSKLFISEEFVDWLEGITLWSKLTSAEGRAEAPPISGGGGERERSSWERREEREGVGRERRPTELVAAEELWRPRKDLEAPGELEEPELLLKLLKIINSLLNY